MADDRLKRLDARLKKIGCNFRFWGRSEVRELANVLLPDEVVQHCVNGSYDGGFALLAATNQRVLLIDKKPFYLTLEDLRFDMITEVDYSHGILNAGILINTPNKLMRFVAYNHRRLRNLFQFVQSQVMEIRQHYQQQGRLWKEYAQNLQPPAAHEAHSDTVRMPVHPSAYHTVAPVISAYTRLPMLSRQRRFLGSRALRSSTIY